MIKGNLLSDRHIITTIQRVKRSASRRKTFINKQAHITLCKPQLPAENKGVSIVMCSELQKQSCLLTTRQNKNKVYSLNIFIYTNLAPEDFLVYLMKVVWFHNLLKKLDFTIIRTNQFIIHIIYYV